MARQHHGWWQVKLFGRRWHGRFLEVEAQFLGAVAQSQSRLAVSHGWLSWISRQCRLNKPQSRRLDLASLGTGAPRPRARAALEHAGRRIDSTRPPPAPCTHMRSIMILTSVNPRDHAGGAGVQLGTRSMYPPLILCLPDEDRLKYSGGIRSLGSKLAVHTHGSPCSRPASA